MIAETRIISQPEDCPTITQGYRCTITPVLFHQQELVVQMGTLVSSSHMVSGALSDRVSHTFPGNIL